MTTVISQHQHRTGDHTTMVTALTSGTICVTFNCHGDGFVSAGRQLTVEQAVRLRDMLSDAIALYPVEVAA